jgi:hypothetical protein
MADLEKEWGQTVLLGMVSQAAGQEEEGGERWMEREIAHMKMKAG